jgi:hypothetical protein
MDGMKLDEGYRQKNGLGPADPESSLPTPKPAHQRLTFDTGAVEETPPPPPPAKPKAAAPPAAPEVAAPEQVGFIDKVLSEQTPPMAKKAKKIKSPKPKLIEPPAAAKPAKKPAKPPAAKAPKKPQPLLNGDTKSRLATIGKVVVLVGLIVFSLYNYLEVKRLNELLGTDVGQQSQNEAKNQELIRTIGTFRALPNSEYEVYTVKDKAKLVNDPVFELAENGDKVIVYPQDSLTIVYRESEGKIISESRDSSLTEKR